MYNDGRIWAGVNESGEKVTLLPKMANRHGLVAGATGTGKTVTLKVLAESFSDMGVPVFIADVKGDIAGLSMPGEDSENMQERIKRFGLADAGFEYKGYPVTLWDIYGEKGVTLRTTITEIGPLLLSRLMELNELQSDILSIVFKIADDNGLLLIDTKDLKAMLNYVSDHNVEFEAEYGKMSPASIAAIVRALVALEVAGGDKFFGEPAVNIMDFFTFGDAGKGMINILDSSSLINNTDLYSTFLLYLLSELFERLPEVGDMDKPKMVFFFDEAHLLFKDAPKALLEKIEQVVKLIRSKGVGVYFCTQNPRDIPDGVLAQLGNKIQHGLRAYTPSDQKAVKAAAEAFRENPSFNTYDTILELGTGEAVVSFLGDDGIPTMAEKTYILPIQSNFGTISESDRDRLIKSSICYSKYYESIDPDSAYEFLQRRGLEEQAAYEQAVAEAEEAKLREKEEKEAEKQREKEEREEARQKEREEREEARQKEREEREAQRQKEREEREATRKAEAAAKAEQREKDKAEADKKRAAKAVGNTITGTVGREVGKTVGGKFGKFGKTLGGNVGASLGRGIFSTLFSSKK
ncbi:MAG: DUF853 family protein [Eubacterium sp.]|nr:DUF853 family protein [Eubacterium sp.]